MKHKRLGALFLALALAVCVSVPALPPLGLATAAGAIPARAADEGYFGRQLHDDPDAKAAAAFYDAMAAMYTDGTLLTGADAEAPGVPAGLEAAALSNAVTTARDAFYMDYPDLFYLNFNNFAVKTEGGRTCITPGSRGRGYLLAGLDAGMVSDMVESYDAVLGAVVDGARTAAPWSGESAQAAQVRAVHDALTRRITYTLDDKCDAANRSFIRTAYGLVTGEGVCEAYSRAFKSAMDALGIPCVLVEGAFRHSAEVVENHMWALVQLGDFWYGVDVTMDDPDDGGPIYTDYLLAGADTMDRQHVPSEAMSAAGYPFRYPAPVMDNYYTTTVHNDNGLKVRLDTAGIDESSHEEGGEGSGILYVSYQGMNYTQAATQGYYILGRYMSLDENGDWVTTRWGYLMPEIYDMITETETETVLPVPHVRYMAFAVTDIPPVPLPPDYKTEDLERTNYYQGDPSLLLATTEMVENPNGTYVAPPYIDKASPSQARTLDIGKSYNVTLHFDDKLVPEKEGGSLGYTLEAYTYIRGKYQDLTKDAEANSTIGPMTLSEDGRTVTFTFRPSEMWAHDNIFYIFHFTGVVGQKSGKAPNTLTYLAAHPCAVCAYQSQGYDWNVYGKPQLMDDPAGIDVAGIKDWTPEEVAGLSALLKDRMTLVVTSPNEDQEADMRAKAADKLGAGADSLTIETYNIALTLCKAQVIKTGQAVRVMLGFPEGYTYEKAKNATFKAYHYSKDDQGNITGDVDEIECIVTERGLLILCNAFSPFAVVADGRGAPDAAEKDLVVNCGEGGSVAVSGGKAKMDGSNKPVKDVYTFTDWSGGTAAVTAQSGYTVESVTLGGKSIAVGSGGAVTVPLSGVEADTATLAVTFAPTEDHWKELDSEVRAAFKAPAAPTMTQDLPASVELQAGAPATLQAAFTGVQSNGIVQWYKDGELLAGAVGESLTVTEPGSYAVKAINFAGPLRTAVQSTPCAVTLAAAAAAPTPTQAAPEAPTPAPTDAAPAETPAPAPAAVEAPAAAEAPADAGTPDAAPTPAPAAVPAAKATPTPAPTPVVLGKGGPEPTPAPAKTPVPAALQNTPAPTPPPTPAPAAANAAATPAPAEHPAASPLRAVSIAFFLCAAAAGGGLAWLLIPRRRTKR